MSADVRTIGRVLEYFHIPIQHSPDQLREVYLSVSNSCDYDNFIRIPDGARLETARSEGGAVSNVTFLRDRIQFREENSSTSLEHFLRRVEECLGVATEALSIPLFIARNLTFRAILSPPSGNHSTQFLAEHMFQLKAEHFQDFERPGHIVGFRMQFPPKDPAREALHQVRIESFLRDPRSLFIEDMATYKQPLQSKDWNRLATEAREVEEFLGDRIVGFLSQFGQN